MEKHKNSAPWYQAFFNDDYMRIYAPFLTPEKTAQEVQDIQLLLNLPPGSRILDLCCGYGRHAIPLAQRGYHVTGLDLSEKLLHIAQSSAAEQGVQVRWLQGDMQSLPFAEEFDAVINLFTSFGYLPNDEDNMQVLDQIYHALKSKGKLLLETVHQPRVLRAFSPHGIIRYEDGLLVLEERRINVHSSRNEVHITLIFPDGRRAEYDQSIRLYTLPELNHMLAAAGLQVIASHGELNRSPLSMDSRLVVISQKAEG
ncbi:MAG TPA: class I SAM-dependent methyltransferase [Ktedonobacteraceae bacterium]|jgi:SAM-dependent methyltransferase